MEELTVSDSKSQHFKLVELLICELQLSEVFQEIDFTVAAVR